MTKMTKYILLYIYITLSIYSVINFSSDPLPHLLFRFIVVLVVNNDLWEFLFFYFIIVIIDVR